MTTENVLQQMFIYVRRLQKHMHGDADATAWQRCRWCAGPIN